MRQGFTDGGNNPHINFVPHPVSTDEERGIPAVGKMVFDTRDAQYYMCVATTPDPTLYGGGTWEIVGGRSTLVQLGVFDLGLTQGADVYSSDEQFSMVRTIYATAPTYEIGWLQGTLAVSATTGATPASAIVPTLDIAPGLFAEGNNNVGTGSLVPTGGGTSIPLHVGLSNTIAPGSSPVQFSLRKSSTGAELGSTNTLASGDIISMSVGFRYYIEL